MKMQEAELWLKQQLKATYEEREAGNIAAWVMEHLTGCNRLDRLVKKEEPLVVQQLHRLTEIVQRLGHHEPVQYVLGEAYFAGLKLFVDANVLVPRPETEELADWAVRDVKAAGLPVFEQPATGADLTTRLKLLDVGTGSGCIALALKKAMPRAEVWGCDASDKALTVARRNASHLDLRVDFVGLNFLDRDQCRQLPTVDIVVSNPPYIPIREKNSLQPNVLQFEPHTALFVPDDDPLLFYKALADFGTFRLHNNGAIYTETHESAGNEVAQLFHNCGYRNIQLRKDLQGKDRMVRATRII